MHPLPNNGLLTCSLRYGIVARSHPLNGKIVKGFLSASGGGAGLGIGNPNMEFAPDVTACALGSDGSTAKVAWGYRNGQVAIVLSKKAMDGKIASDYTRCSVSDDHEGAVVDVAWDGDMVVTAGDDGRMKVWQKRHSAILCLWSSTKDESAVIPPKCIKLVSALSNGYVACVMNNGDVIVWHGFILHGELDVDNISTTRVRSLYRSSQWKVQSTMHHKSWPSTRTRRCQRPPCYLRTTSSHSSTRSSSPVTLTSAYQPLATAPLLD
ncbi:hypothetical protein BD626DRAFT_33818 [Schizophyllum amplum]|uniref:Uncharacterized protein n=1 Tax=Schizophyllum amplum TaxID=97359 RepID=A0A550CED1_9AGAR|nr:hypothetical protein BD626DRAFT_33818 [Auriculariopsis ampla]